MRALILAGLLLAAPALVADPAQNLADAVRFKTVSHQDSSRVDYAEFDRLIAFLRLTYPRVFSELDVEVFEFLSQHMNRQALAAITNPRLPAAYFRTLKDALGKARLYDGLTLCSLGRTTSAEMVAEVADLLLRMEGVRAVFCGGLVRQSYYVSVRTEVGGDAWSLIRAGMDGEDGSSGGHGSVAGGSITLDCADSRTLRRLERRLERNILKAMGVSGANAATLGEDDD